MAKRAKHLAAAAISFGLGMYLRGFKSAAMPMKESKTALQKLWNGIPKDPKLYAKVILGIFSVNQLNRALNINPPPWLSGMESVAAIHPLMIGFKDMPQFMVTLPFVAAIVEVTNLLNKAAVKPLNEQAGIPKWVTGLGVYTGMIVAGLAIYPKLFSQLAKSGILGAKKKKDALGGKLVAATGVMTCPRGCTPGGFICLSELGEMASGMVNYLKPGKAEV